MSSPFVDAERLLFKNKIHSILTNFSAYFQEEFEKTDIKKCEKCNGSGLPCKPGKEITYWSPGTICDNCGGFGFIFSEINGNYICKKCNGVGCQECKNGFVDWVAHAMGR